MHQVLGDFGGCFEASGLASFGCLLEDLGAESLHLLFDGLVLDGARGLGQEVLEDLVLVGGHLEEAAEFPELVVVIATVGFHELHGRLLALGGIARSLVRHTERLCLRSHGFGGVEGVVLAGVLSEHLVVS